MIRQFHQNFIARKSLFGAFVKTPAYQGMELLAQQGFDFAVIDEEHAPFNRESVDALILAARATKIAPLVRVPGIEGILQALDCGAEGVMVPHITSPDSAKAAVEACYYGIGRRGYSPSGRAGRYGGVKRGEHVTEQDKSNALIAMIEDPEAIDQIEAICAVPGLTGLFIGRGDLTAAFGASALDAPEVVSAVNTILKAAKTAGLPVMMNVSNRTEADAFAALFSSAFIIGSDQGFLKKGARLALADYAGLTGGNTD